MKTSDVLIIGSGISGLTCAALLAKKGKTVRVLEAYSKPGGYMHCFKRFGITFDTGAHYVGAMRQGDPFYSLLKYLGAYDPDVFLPLDTDAYDVFQFPSGRFQLGKGYEKNIQHLSEHFPSEAQAIRKYFELIKTTAEAFPTYHFNVSFDHEAVRKAMETPLSTVVEDLTTNPLLKCLFYSYCSLHGVRPQHVPFGPHAIITDSLVSAGAFGFRRGGDDLTQKLIKAVESYGGEVLLNQRVEKLVVKNKTITEVVTSKDVFEARWVISAIHPKSTFALMDESVLSPAFKTRLQSIEESLGIFAVYASCKAVPDFAPYRNYYYFKNEDPETFLYEDKTPYSPAMVFLSRPGKASEKENIEKPSLNFHSPISMELFKSWSGSKYGKRPPEYEKFKTLCTEQAFDIVEKYQPQFRNILDKWVTSTPLTNLHFNGSEDGSGYGIYHSIKNTGARSLGPRTHLSNLLLTGQSTSFPGLQSSAISGLRTTGQILGIKPLLAELMEVL